MQFRTKKDFIIEDQLMAIKETGQIAPCKFSDIQKKAQNIVATASLKCSLIVKSLNLNFKTIKSKLYERQ